MGDLNSVDIAQNIHECLLQASSCLQADHWMQLGKPLRGHHLFEGVYIDDHLVAAVVKRPDVHKAVGPDCDIINKSRAVCAAAYLPVSASKAFDLKTTSTAWGTEVRNDPVTAGAPRHRRLQLFVLTMLLLSAPGVTKAAI